MDIAAVERVDEPKESIVKNFAPGAIDFDRALIDPASQFTCPENVLVTPGLRIEQKIEILCRWTYDATELAVAEEEGMGGGEPSNLGDVIKALDMVTGGFDVEHTGPTKHAGLCVL
jgi:hypothetical protein